MAHSLQALVVSSALARPTHHVDCYASPIATLRWTRSLEADLHEWRIHTSIRPVPRSGGVEHRLPDELLHASRWSRSTKPDLRYVVGLVSNER